MSWAHMWQGGATVHLEMLTRDGSRSHRKKEVLPQDEGLSCLGRLLSHHAAGGGMCGVWVWVVLGAPLSGYSQGLVL